MVALLLAAKVWHYWLSFAITGTVLLVFIAFGVLAGMVSQLTQSYTNFEPELYLKVMFGLQLVDYLLFALLALVIHVVVVVRGPR